MSHWREPGRWGRVAAWSVVLAAAVGLLTYRCHAYFVNPDLRAEDGSQVYAFFFANRDLRALIRFKAGYLPLLPNLLGYVSARLPPPAAAYFLTLAPALFAVFAFSAFNAATFRRHVPSDALRVCCCLGLAIAPLGTNFLTCHTDYSIWNLFLALLLLVLLPMPQRKWLALAFSALLMVLIWSHPLSIAAAPATLAWLCFDKRAFSRVLNAGVLLGQGLHVRYGTHPESATADPHARGVSTHVLAVFENLSRHLLAVLTQFSFPQVTALSVRVGQACSVVFLLALLLCALLAKNAVASRACFAWVLYCIAVPLLLVLFTRPDRIVESTRYVYVARSFATLGACLLFWQCVRWLAARLMRLTHLTRFRIGQVIANGAPALAVLSYCVGLNQPGANGRYEQPHPDNGLIIHACLARLAELKAKSGSPCHLFVRCQKKHGDWPFAIDTRRACVD